jgi:hypothetical protein
LSSSEFKDDRWSESKFGLQQVKDVIKALKWIEKQDITRYNIQSISTAKLGTVVVGALAGKKARTSAEDFLPFDTRKTKKESGITEESLWVLKDLMKTRKMDGKIIGMLAEEIKQSSLRESPE